METIRILHVDDDPDFTELSVTFLEREDERLEVETATSVSEGLDRLGNGEFDCVISDYEMPDRDGIEFLEAVRAEDTDLPFVLYTGKGSEEVASEAISAGVTDYLQKQRGSSQYAVLANRVTNAVAQYRSSQRAAELDRVRTLSKAINQELVRAESPLDAKERVCEAISDSEPYLLAWIGDVDPETDRLEPQAAAGEGRGYLDDVTITVDAAPTGQGPAGTAVRERRIVVSQDIAEDPAFEPWRRDALDRGFQAVAVVPLEYQDSLYGELVVYADRPNAFDANERGLLAEISRDIAHVLHSFEVRGSLREERDFIEQALDSLQDVFYVVNTDGTFRRWNDRLVAASGYTDEAIGEMEAVDLFPDDDRPRINEAIEETLTTGESTAEADILTADGEIVPYEFTGSRLTDLEGELVGLIGIGRDLTERKQREYRLKRLIDNLPGVIYRCRNEPGWPMEEVRGELEELTGYHSAELEERAGFYGEEIIHPDDQDAVWSTIQDALEERRSFEITYRIRTRTNGVKWVRERGQGVYAADGELAALEGFITDVSRQESQKQVINALHKTAQSVMRADTAERAAQIAVETIQDVLDMPACAVHLHDEGDADGGLVPTVWTDLVEELVGEPPTFSLDGSLAGKAFETGEPQIYDDVSRVPERYNPETSIGSEIIFPLGEHGVLLIASLEADAFDEGDISLAETVAAHTTTALDRIERERALERQNERLDEFASIVSHDLRNPLGVAEGYLELSQRECDSENLEAVGKAHTRMRVLLDDLLELAREGADVTDLSPVDLAALVDDCWENVDTADATPEVELEGTVQADRSRLAQLLENLIRNAIEHGGADVTVEIGGMDGGFYVADDGEGIPADARDQIFQSGYTTRPDGTGFGLPIVQQIADAHGWEIEVTESKRGGGRFELTGLERVPTDR